MASVNVGSSAGSSTGNTTDNPQSTGQYSGIGVGQNPQSSVSTSSINNEGTGSNIPLQSTSLRTSSIQPIEVKSTHKVSSVAFIPIAILVVLAVALCIYIYVTSKKSASKL
jgi:hypothetical protein